MKPKLLLILGTIATIATAFVLLWSITSSPRRHSSPQTAVSSLSPPVNVAPGLLATSGTGAQQRLPRGIPNAAQRLARLEQLGELPEDADDKDWRLARKATWWGKRLNAGEFWKNRTIWLDTSAEMAAHRHGRLYPPIPNGDLRFAYRSDEDRTTRPDVEGFDMGLKYTDRESVFWDTFSKTHPKPPDQITTAQIDLAHEILGSRHQFEREGNPLRTTDARLESMDVAARHEVQTLGYPSEAFSNQALNWAYVAEQRSQYQQMYVRTHAENTLWSSNFLATVWVEPDLITEPLTVEQLKAANSWKVAYLQRLRREKTDDSYINDYLKAWKLSAEDVFGPTNR